MLCCSISALRLSGGRASGLLAGPGAVASALSRLPQKGPKGAKVGGENRYKTGMNFGIAGRLFRTENGAVEAVCSDQAVAPELIALCSACRRNRYETGMRIGMRRSEVCRSLQTATKFEVRSWQEGIAWGGAQVGQGSRAQVHQKFTVLGHFFRW